MEPEFKYSGIGADTLAFKNLSGLGQPGVGTLKADGKVVDTKKMERTLPMIPAKDSSRPV